MALAEPLVDIVESRAVISNTQPILNLDIMKCRKEDLTFRSEFSLKFSRNDFCHAFVAYFECAFSLVHKPIVFTTSPHAKYTHWKQVVYYLQEPLTVCSGEDLSAVIDVAPNAKNPSKMKLFITQFYVFLMDIGGCHHNISLTLPRGFRYHNLVFFSWATFAD